jgi:hypothetical protein
MENELSRQRPLIFLQLSHLLLLIQFVALAIVKLMPRPSAPASNHAIAQALGLYGAIIIDPADAQDEVKADHRQSRTGPKIRCDLASEETWQAAHSLSHPAPHSEQ